MKTYLDYAATAPPRKEVLEAMASVGFGNPASFHSIGIEAREALEKARETIARLIGALPEEIIFTSGATESNNIALKGTLDVLARRADSTHDSLNVIVSAIEHPSVLEVVDAEILTVNRDGIVKLDKAEELANGKPALVSVHLANNEIGTIQPIAELRKIFSDSVFHTDATQALGRIPIDVKELGVDLLSGSAHKLGGPRGVGLLYVRKGVKIKPLLYGGGQETGVRSGTVNVAGAVGFAKALELSVSDMGSENKRLTELRDKIFEFVESKGGIVNGSKTERLANNANFRFSGKDGQGMVLKLDDLGYCVSTGSACSGSKNASHVLKAIGLSEKEALSSLRVTMGYGTTEENVTGFLEGLSDL